MRVTGRRALALAMIGTAGVGAAGMTGLALAAKAPANRALSVKGYELRFDKKSLRAPSGRVNLVLTNRGDLAHNVALRGRGLAKPRLGKVVGKGKVSRVTAVLRPGRYVFYCSVFGHEDGGMRGTLVVPAPPRR